MPVVVGRGSSPRVRGTVRQSGVQRPKRRFIPACAGNGARRRRVRRQKRGSSPRVRGTESIATLSAAPFRFIPACAGNGPIGPSSSGSPSVHPRVCGERGRALEDLVLGDGSSPRVRGTGLALGALAQSRRFIPACAGNGWRSTKQSRSLSVHPRVCGERTELLPGRISTAGSSPRVRGTVDERGLLLLVGRFIPACAGNGYGGSHLRSQRPVHPRVCGERDRFAAQFGRLHGSSPRVRGTVRKTSPEEPRARFIPACAGNGRVYHTDERGRMVHPRVCGERSAWKPASAAYSGSSPRVRGTVGPAESSPDHQRFIPACAGNGTRQPPAVARLAVHPRVCGERAFTNAILADVDGSSPRVRGTDWWHDVHVQRRRFIPACAGNGSSWLRVIVSSSVHPRVCGERANSTPMKSEMVGSSPRVRGTGPGATPAASRRRFIPACAGNGGNRRLTARTSTVHPRVCGERWKPWSECR